MLKRLFAVVCLSFLSLQASEISESWLTYPLRDEGRIKPFATFAQGKLLQFSGKSKVYQFIPKREKLMSASEWMTHLLFSPEKVDSLSIFLINDPQIQTTLGQEERDYRMYSYAELDSKRFLLQEQARLAEEVQESDRSEFQREILRINNNLTHYEAYRKSFEFFKPSEAFSIKDSITRQRLLLGDRQTLLSYFDVYRKAGLLRTTIDSLIFKPREAWTSADSSSFEVSRTLFEWSEVNQLPLPEMVPFTHNDQWHWISPWEVLSNRLLSFDSLNSEMTWLYLMYQDWNNEDLSSFNTRADTLLQSVEARAATGFRVEAIHAERIYHRLDPFINAQFLLGFGLILSLLGLLYKPRLLQRSSSLFLIAGTTLTLTGIGLRMYINHRPPVTTLFETFVFVAATCALLAIALSVLKSLEVGNLMGNFSALVLLMISNKYAAEGDTLKVLVAVLDSNFWLATHVVSITLGYAGVCAAGVVSHIYMLQKIFKKSPEKLDATYRSMMGMVAFGLVLSFIGTVLGGIWADQSWGRFWGWDPKENGALLIVLWCSMLYHARLAGWLKKPAMVIGNMFGVIVVMLAWFGINLLGVGLHSYGFTSGVAGRLFAYVSIQLIIIISSAVYFVKKKEKLF